MGAHSVPPKRAARRSGARASIVRRGPGCCPVARARGSGAAPWMNPSGAMRTGHNPSVSRRRALASHRAHAPGRCRSRPARDGFAHQGRRCGQALPSLARRRQRAGVHAARGDARARRCRDPAPRRAPRRCVLSRLAALRSPDRPQWHSYPKPGLWRQVLDKGQRLATSCGSP